MYKCKICEQELDDNQFYPSLLKHNDIVCKECHRIRKMLSRHKKQALKPDPPRNKHNPYFPDNSILCDSCKTLKLRSDYDEKDLARYIYICKYCKQQFRKSQLDSILEDYIHDS